jgi:hypothetical protein
MIEILRRVDAFLQAVLSAVIVNAQQAAAAACMSSPWP